MHILPSEEPEFGDAFGAALRQCYDAGQRAGAAFEVIERSDGLISVGDAVKYFAGFEDWPDYEQEALTEVRGRVLDVGCGAGRHAAVIANAGHEVIGIDTSPQAVGVAQARDVHAVRGEATAFPRQIGKFSTILLLGHNLGLLGGPHQAATVLTELAQISEPGAQILASGRNPYTTAEAVHRRYHEQNRQHGRMPGQARIRIRHDRSATPYFDYLFCSELELAELTASSSWHLAEIRPAAYGDYLAFLQLQKH